MAIPIVTSLYNPTVEASALAILLKFGSDVWGEFDLITRADFSEAHRPIFDTIRIQLGTTPPGSMDPVLLSEKMRSMGKSTLPGNIEPLCYLEGLLNRFVEREEASNYARELKRLTVRRELIERMDAAKSRLATKADASFEDMTGLVERELSHVTTAYHKPEVTEVFGNLIQVIENRAAAPLKAEEAGFLGPFRSINETLGAIVYKGSFSLVGARSSVGKSSLSWFYTTYLLERYPNLHVLHLDSAEMTYEELCWRAVCCLSEGKIPYWAVFRGEWEKNKEWAQLIRGKLWPRVQKMVGRMSYKNIGGMSPGEQLAFIKRYYFNKVGRSSHLVVNLDYLKGLEVFHKNTQEYQAVGNFVGDLKTLITDDIEASVWTSIQNNRSGITTNKTPDEIADDEGAFSLSDRINQQATHSFHMRFKTPEELARQLRAFGNIKLSPVKKRQLLGEKYMDMLHPVKIPNGKLVPNSINLEHKAFFYLDRGTTKEMLETLGQGVVTLGDGQTKHVEGI